MTAVALTRTGAVSSGTLENDAPMAKSAAPAEVERLSRMMRDGFDPIWRLLRRLGVSADAADDAAQEVFMVAARRIHEIEAGSEQSYLYGTALRVAKSHHRRQASSSARHVPLDESRLSASTSPEQALDQRQRLALLDDALGDLDQDERSVFVLFENRRHDVDRDCRASRHPPRHHRLAIAPGASPIRAGGRREKARFAWLIPSA